jgi:dolichol kinase
MSVDLIYLYMNLILYLISWLNSIFESFQIHFVPMFPFDFLAFLIYELSKDSGQLHSKLPEGFILVVLLKRLVWLSIAQTYTSSLIDNLIIALVWPSKTSGYLTSLCILSFGLYINGDSAMSLLDNSVLIASLVIVIATLKYVSDVFLRLEKSDSDVLIFLLCQGLLYVSNREQASPIGVSSQEEEALAFATYLILVIVALGTSLLIFRSSIRQSYGSQILLAMSAGACLAMLTSNTSILHHLIVIFDRIVAMMRWMIVHKLLAHGAARFIVCLAWILAMVLFIPWAHQITAQQHVVIARKSFHIVAVMMFMPVTVLYPDFMLMAYSVSLSAFVLIEFIRIYLQVYAQDITKDDLLGFVADKIEAFYVRFLDEKDHRTGMILSHCYLILGCAIPLAYATILEILINQQQQTLSHSHRLLRHLGWISVGIGDTAGAVVGIHYGKHRWMGSRKTWEGSAGGFIAMMLASLLMMTIEAWLHDQGSVITYKDAFMLLVVMTLVSIAEALTGENDNLIMPLIASASYSLAVIA